MSSKSHDAAGVAIARANFRQERFLCTRLFQNRIADSVYTLLKDKVEAFGLSNNFKIYADAIEHKTNGSLFRFYGIARNIDEIKSFEGASVWWNEESHNLNKEMFQTIRPTIMRNDEAEMWFTLNPGIITDYSYQRLIAKPPKGFLVHQVNYPDNPYLNESALLDIEKEFEEDSDEATHIYLGVPRSSDSRSYIKLTWINAAVDAHIKLGIDLSGPKNVGYDVADDGGDRCSVTVFNGGVATQIDSWKAKEDELEESALRAWAHSGNGMFAYDCIGVGASVGSILKSNGHSKGYAKFHAGEAPKFPNVEYASKIKNKDKFENRKAQAWQSVADRFRNTYNAVTKGTEYPPDQLISISSMIPEIEALKTELATPYREKSGRDKDMVEKKSAIKKRLKTEESPDLADSFIMGACTHLSEFKVMTPISIGFVN
tara:strand:- start:108 stop:1397 length:1290 start_codon:yes stop_codon:yes gene_type:complete